MVCNRIGLTVNNIYCGDQYISKVMGCRNAFTPLNKDFPTAVKKMEGTAAIFGHKLTSTVLCNDRILQQCIFQQLSLGSAPAGKTYY